MDSFVLQDYLDSNVTFDPPLWFEDPAKVLESISENDLSEFKNFPIFCEESRHNEKQRRDNDECSSSGSQEAEFLNFDVDTVINENYPEKAFTLDLNPTLNKLSPLWNWNAFQENLHLWAIPKTTSVKIFAKKHPNIWFARKQF